MTDAAPDVSAELVSARIRKALAVCRREGYEPTLISLSHRATEALKRELIIVRTPGSMAVHGTFDGVRLTRHADESAPDIQITRRHKL